MVETIRVVIADDHPLFRCGVRQTLHAADDVELVGEAGRGDKAQRLCREMQPDVLLLDLQMPGATAVETAMYVREWCPQTRVIILTAYDDEVYVRRMLAEGAVGYVLKDDVTDAVITAIRSVMQGGMHISQRLFGTVMRPRLDSQLEGGLPHLTQRERQVLDSMARGWRNAQIATELSLAEQTVRHHISRVYAKLGVSSRSEALIWAKKHGFGLE